MFTLIGEKAEVRKQESGTEDKDGVYVDYTTFSRVYYVLGDNVDEEPSEIQNAEYLDIPRLWDTIDGMTVSSVNIVELCVTIDEKPLYEVTISGDSRVKATEAKVAGKWPLKEGGGDDEGAKFNIPSMSFKWESVKVPYHATKDFSPQPKEYVNAVGEPIIMEHYRTMPVAVLTLYTLRSVELDLMQMHETLNNAEFAGFPARYVKLETACDYEEIALNDDNNNSVVWKKVTLRFFFSPWQMKINDNGDMDRTQSLHLTILAHTGTKYRENGKTVPVLVGTQQGKCFLNGDGSRSFGVIDGVEVDIPTSIVFQTLPDADFSVLSKMFDTDIETILKFGLGMGLGDKKLVRKILTQIQKRNLRRIGRYHDLLFPND